MDKVSIVSHTRPITQLVYNLEGDLLFSSGKDKRAMVYAAATGKRLGTYDGHSGAINYMTVTSDSTILLTASADYTIRAWRVKTGECLHIFQHDAPVFALALNEGETQLVSVSGPFSTAPAHMNFWDFDKTGQRCMFSRISWTK